MVNGAGGQANGWAGLTGGGGWRVDSSPASSARSRPLLAPLRRRRRRRARPRCPECTARRAAPSGRERRKVSEEGREDGEGACVRARGGEAGRRLVTQQNARAPPPRLRTLCFRAPRGFLELSTERAGPPRCFATLPAPPRPPAPRKPRSCRLPVLHSRVSKPLAANRPTTRTGRFPRETAGLPREAAGCGRLRRVAAGDLD